LQLRKLEKNEKQSSRVKQNQRMSPDTPNKNIFKKDLAREALRMRKQSDDEDLVETTMLPINSD
tara:strand:- start:1219 stop:1410 length:192 start_codon:yes stop_codon:yes gene_type:complete